MIGYSIDVRIAIGLAGLLSGCSFSAPPGVVVDSGPGADGNDAADDAGCASRWAPDHVDPCLLPDPPGAAIVIATGETWTYDTTTGTLTDDDGSDVVRPTITVALDPEVRLLYITDLSIESGGTFLIDGSMPLVIGATNEVDIDGLLDLTPKNDVGRAGSNPLALCQVLQAGTSEAGGSGGGGGGAFQGTGGMGGTGDNDGNNALGGGGGTGVGVPTTPRGGCSGADGGDPGGNNQGPAGAGGGAVQVSAAVRVRIRGGGAINAGGGGGVGGNDQGGGGGGGSGGYIRVEAPVVRVQGGGALTANGGGGGAGGDTLAGSDGEDGPATLDGGAGGMANGVAASNGADGGGEIENDGRSQDVSTAAGAGGGGGTAGYVILPANADINSGTVSPEFDQQP